MTHPLDGEVEWKSPASMQFMLMLPKENSDELIKYWSYFIETKVDGNDRTLAIDFKTGEPGTYSGTYDFEKQTWSTQAIDTIEFAVYCRPGDSRNYDAFTIIRNG